VKHALGSPGADYRAANEFQGHPASVSSIDPHENKKWVMHAVSAPNSSK
jgi:hypothetical protein